MAYVTRTLVTSGGRDAVHDKGLSICLAADGFSFAEVSAQGELLALGTAEGEHAASMTDLTRDVKAFFATLGVRTLGFRKMELVVVSDESVWVPDELYGAAQGRNYLRLAGATGLSAMAVPCRSIASTAVFAADERMVTAFKVALPGLTVTSQHVRLASLAPRSGSHPVLLAHWRDGRVDVAAFADGRYLYGNTLAFADESAALFQLMEVAKTYGLQGPDTELLMCGDVSRERFAAYRPYFRTTTLFTGTCRAGAEFKGVHTYRHALLLI